MGSPRLAPSVDNYLISKGYIQIAKWNGGVVGAYADVGNCTKFDMQPTEETLPHFSSRNAVREQDQEVVVQTGCDINFSLDEVAVENLRMFLKASQSGTRILYGNMNTNQLYAIKFIPTNEIGPSVTYEFWKVKVTPNGALSLIGDEYTVMSFSGKVMSDRAYHSTSPFFTATYDTTTSSTTTTSTAA